MALDKHLNDPKHRQYLKKRKVNSNPVNIKQQNKRNKKKFIHQSDLLYFIWTQAYITHQLRRLLQLFYIDTFRPIRKNYGTENN